MAEQHDVSRIPPRIGRIIELAYNVWWSWHPAARDLFRDMDYPLWRNSGHNPVKMLFETTLDNLEGAAEDPEFLALYDRVIADFDKDIKSEYLWFASQPRQMNGPVAYFSMEFALHNSLPIYAGGLGILAGDMCKEASDLGLPLTGIGFMYPQGYFHQHVSEDGWQQEIFQQLNFKAAPIKQITLADGNPVIATVQLAERPVSLAVWVVQVGRVPIYLLDTNLAENSLDDRKLSARLYTAEAEIRIQQEIILGIGGVRVLKSLGVQPAVWHANEGHSAFMTLERIRSSVHDGLNFETAFKNVSDATVFTTHTPVASGHDVFQRGLIEKYFKIFWQEMGIDQERFMQLGAPDSQGYAGFNMTALAINIARQSNAVSRLHETETKKMWRVVWPDRTEDHIPIIHITNGVHGPTWIANEWRELYEKYLGRSWEKWQDEPEFWKHLRNIPNEEIWAVHRAMKSRLIEVVMGRAQLRWAEGDVSGNQIISMGALLNPNILTIGFARRLTDYKRAAMIFQDSERLKKILTDPIYPVQLIFAGKAHPNDFGGKQILQRIYNLAKDRQFQGRIAFVEDYDMHFAHYLTHGSDVWLNNPRRLLEASGTSGMKAALNGVLNMSVRDGWWDEAYNGLNGWAIGPGPEGADAANQDTLDAESIYQLLENKVKPLYYTRDYDGVPNEWVKMIKESVLSILPNFSTTRMVKEYTGKLYLAKDGQKTLSQPRLA
jgi:glycogen phosphorylase